MTRIQALSPCSRALGAALAGCLALSACSAPENRASRIPGFDASTFGLNAEAVYPVAFPPAHRHFLRPARPTIDLAFQALYGRIPPAGKYEVDLPQRELATLYHLTLVRNDAGLRQLLLFKRTGRDRHSHADAAILDAVSLRRERGQWVIDALAQNLAAIGSNGDSPVLLGSLAALRVEQHPVGKGYTGVFLPGEEMHFGVQDGYLVGIGVGDGQLQPLGIVPILQRNEFECEPHPPGEICHGWKGQLSVRPRVGDWADLVLTRKGNERGGVKAVDALYRWDEAENAYREHKR